MLYGKGYPRGPMPLDQDNSPLSSSFLLRSSREHSTVDAVKVMNLISYEKGFECAICALNSEELKSFNFMRSAGVLPRPLSANFKFETVT